ncbi:MAG: hypothetical protein JST58_16565 [Bacteroidetes bacterium]|jgi:hypothetical protein|nr:hypothetical protein [Bacteroidota bacterium]
MKTQSQIPQVGLANLPQPKGSYSLTTNKIKFSVPPPKEDFLQKQNEMVKTYPFCVYYKQKKNDPL